MIVYAISGIVLTFRNTDYLKNEIQYEKNFNPDITADELSKALGRRFFKVNKEEGGIIYFQGGTYNKKQEWQYIQQWSFPCCWKT